MKIAAWDWIVANLGIGAQSGMVVVLLRTRCADLRGEVPTPPYAAIMARFAAKMIDAVLMTSVLMVSVDVMSHAALMTVVILMRYARMDNA